MARILLIGCLGLALWISAVVSPFVLAHLFEMKSAAARAWTFAALAGSALVVIGFLCYLLDRI